MKEATNKFFRGWTRRAEEKLEVQLGGQSFLIKTARVGWVETKAPPFRNVVGLMGHRPLDLCCPH